MSDQPDWCRIVSNNPEGNFRPDHYDKMCLLSLFDRIDFSRKGFLDKMSLDQALTSGDNAPEAQAIKRVELYLPEIGHLIGTEVITREEPGEPVLFAAGTAVYCRTGPISTGQSLCKPLRRQPR